MTRRATRAFAAGLLLMTTLAGCVATPIGSSRAPRDDPDAGLLVLPSGRAIPVYPAQLRFTGRAEYRWPDGRLYEGEWQAGMPHGRGLETRPDGESYRGAWREGRRHGLGELLAVGGGLYQGEFQDGVRQGKGVLFSADGVYQGEWVADRQHGYGELAGAYGSLYTGEWRNGQRSGRGSYRGADGTTYDGDWQEDRPHGFGIYGFADGAVYEGQWQGGRQQGTGRLLALSGVTYEGDWLDAQRSGFGIETRPDGGRYAGEWLADKRHGQGREQWPDGGFHEGVWELNRPMGPGHRRYVSGIEIQGAWNGDSVSSGLLTLPGGPEYAGPLLRNANTRMNPLLQRWLETMAAAGDPHARLMAGTMYLDYTEPEPDPAFARGWLGAAGDAVAETAFRLGVLLLETSPADQQAEGLRWLEQAAGQGHAEAHRLLGDLYAAGTDKPPGLDRPADHARAITHYTASLRAGSPLAAMRLARLLVETDDPRLRDPTRAIAVLEWVALHEGFWQQFDTLALAYAAGGDTAAAARALERAIDAATPAPGALPDWPRPRPGTPVPAGIVSAEPVAMSTPGSAHSPLIQPPPGTPDIPAMRARLERYRAAQP